MDLDRKWIDYNSGNYVKTGQSNTEIDWKHWIRLDPFIARQVKLIFDETSADGLCRNARFDFLVEERFENSVLALYEGGAAFEFDTSWNGDWENPRLESAKGIHSGPFQNCDGTAEWTVIMPKKEGN